MADSERQRWDRLEALLEALEDIPAEQRAQRLTQMCPDPELRREAQRLLDATPASTGYLDRLFDGLVPKRGRQADLTGRRIGAYRLLRLLGRGGMGVVYAAERADGTFAQRVALKLLTTPLIGTETHDRFLAERRILATLEHPAIAHILDGGVTDDGTPWFAMEYVEGEAITKYCDRHRLDIRQRLELFLQVCDAVEHAHRRLVVHRDLKPINILVAQRRPGKAEERTREPGDAISLQHRENSDHQVKLLDFGIAKLLDTGHTDSAPETRTALRLMTPEYASPEQVRGQPVTTASDVYQLGLLLYELLTGHRPYALKHRGPGELERVICEQPPTRLSAVVTHEDSIAGRVPEQEPPADAFNGTRHDIISALCDARRTTPGKLRRRLRGDLENIVLKALSKEPERRYGTADRLMQDIRRQLSGLPVTARADTWFYRGRKFLGRHAVGASITAVTLLLVLSLAAGMIGFHMVRIQNERDLAQLEALKAQQVSDFLVGLFRSADPLESPSADISVREALDRGRERVDRDLASQPEVQADMLRALGRTYMELGLYDTAADLLARALELHLQWLGPGHPDSARTIAELGVLRFRQGEMDAARAHMESATSALEAALGPDTPELAAILRMLGPTYHRLGEHAKGLATLERALAIHTRVAGEDSEQVAATLNNMGVMLFEMGELERAETLQERALAIRERDLGRDHPWVAINLVNLANVKILRGTPEGAEAMLRRSLVTLRNAYGPDHGYVGLVLTNLGSYLVLSGRSDEAVEVLEQALEIMRAALGANNPQVAMPTITLALAHQAGGRFTTARDYYRRTVELRETAYGDQYFDSLLIRGLIGLGRAENELGNTAAATRLFERVLAGMDSSSELTDPLFEQPFHYLGRWLIERGRCDQARPLLHAVVRIQDAQQRPLHPDAGRARDLLESCFRISTDADPGMTGYADCP